MKAIKYKIYAGLQTRVLLKNTKIGGVSATINTANLLATKLGINVARISQFTIVGSDIECSVSGNYTLPYQFFNNDNTITYFKDSDSLVTSSNAGLPFYNCANITDVILYGMTSLGNTSFGLTPKLELLYLPNTTTIPNNAFAQGNKKIFYIPLATNLGDTPSSTNVFSVGNTGSLIYCNPSLSTNNAGGENANIVYARSIGCDIRYVTNFTKPNIASVSNIGVINNNSLQFISFGTNANAIDYFEISINGGAIQKVPVNQYLTGLVKNTSYSLSVVAVDIFLNKATASVINVSTANNATAFPVTGLKSYYRLDENSGLIAYDSFGADNLTNTGVTINKAGKVTNSSLSTATGQKLASTTATPITGNFTINLWVYRTKTADQYSALYEQGLFNDNTGFGIWASSNNDLSWRINNNFNHYNASTFLALNTWVMVTVVYNGTNVKIYINSILKQTDAMTTNPTTSAKKAVFVGHDGAMFYGRQSELSIHNIELTQAQITALYNGGNGISL
jgi:hypothetical protein